MRIAASGLALQGCLLRVLARYRREFPHVRICLTNHSAPQGWPLCRTAWPTSPWYPKDRSCRIPW
ncbi:MAG: hypothetical protein ACLUNQ_08515 [Oscillospiraceae bacterium]